MVIEILKIPGENNSIYRVKPLWKDNSFELLLLDDSTAWHAEITEEYLTKLAKDRAQTTNDYYTQIKECLSKTENDFTFNLNNDKNEFIIKRKIGGRTIIFFNIKLSKLNFQECLFNLIDELLENNVTLNKELKQMEKHQNVLIEEKNVYVNKLVEFVEIKTNWEQEMYSNFLIVLNEKKKRIKFLTDILTHKNINPDEIQIPETSNGTVSEKKHEEKRVEILSDSGTDSEYETDNEDRMVIEEDLSPKPSTSKTALDSDEEELSTPALRLPKLIKPSQEKFLSTKIKESNILTGNVLTQELSESQKSTQEIYLSTQERIDRM